MSHKYVNAEMRPRSIHTHTHTHCVFTSRLDLQTRVFLGRHVSEQQMNLCVRACGDPVLVTEMCGRGLNVGGNISNSKGFCLDDAVVG